MPMCRICGHEVQAGRPCPICGSHSASGSDRGVDRGDTVHERPVKRRPTPTAESPTPDFSVEEEDEDTGKWSNLLVGDVVETKGPHNASPSFNWWKLGTILLLIIFLGPVILTLALVLFSLKLALMILGISRGARGRSWLDEILIFHVIGSAFRKPEPVPVYSHIVKRDNPPGLVLAKQMGEFVDGQICQSNHVRLRGRSRRGTFWIDSGSYNETLDVTLNLESNPWRTAFFVTVVLAAGVLILLSVYQSTPIIGP
ncbi:MAG: hypothetical protein P9L99_11135 [Candidatus Lernaella stagnicola]|nr:hypothetical protein [Candidatus Lernaella stagnicola]